MKKYAIFLLALLLIAGCGNVKYIDVSQNSKYKNLVGKTYEVTGNVTAYVIDERSRGIEPYITVRAPPGIGGPEVVGEREIPIGTILTVTHVEKTNRFIECKTSLRLSPLDFQKEGLQKYKVRLEIRTGNEGGTCESLNPKHYREIFKKN